MLKTRPPHPAAFRQPRDAWRAPDSRGTVGRRGRGEPQAGDAGDARAAGIAVVSRRREPRTTRRAVRIRPAPDRVARRFEAAAYRLTPPARVAAANGV